MNCKNCDKKTPRNVEYCPECKAELYPEITNSRWTRSPGQCAVKISINDFPYYVEWFFKKKKVLFVDPGTQAILLQGGQIVDQLEPGHHEVDNVLNKINKDEPIEAILADSGNFKLQFSFSKENNLVSGDPADIENLSFSFYVKITDSMKVFRNLMKEKHVLTVNDLATVMRSEITDTVLKVCKEVKIAEKDGKTSLQEKLESAFISLAFFKSNGLQFFYIDQLSLESELINLVIDPDKEAKISEAKIDAFLKMLSTDAKTQEAELKQSYQELTFEEKRIVYRERLRHVANSAELDEIKDENDFLQKILLLKNEKKVNEKLATLDLKEEELSHFLKDEELDELKKQFLDKKNDTARLRSFIVDKMVFDNQLDLDLHKSERQFEKDLLIDKGQAERAFQRDKRKIEDQRNLFQEKVSLEDANWQLEKQKKEFEIEKTRLETEHEKLRTGLTEVQKDKEKLIAEKDIEIKRLSDKYELEIDKSKADQLIGIQENTADLLAKMRETKNKQKHQKEMNQVDIEERRSDIDDTSKNREQKRKIEMLNAHTESVKQLSVSQLLAMPGTDINQVNMLGKVAEIEAFKSMSKDQLLAVKAGDNPELLKIMVSEMASSMKDGTDTKHVDEMIKLMQEQVSNEKDHTKQMLEMSKHSSNQMTEITKILAGKQQQTTVVTASPQNVMQQPCQQPPMQQTQTTLNCRHCNYVNDGNNKFCGNCQQPLR